MARRTAAKAKTRRVHVYQEDKDNTPGICRYCPLIEANEVHVPADDPRLAEQDQAQEAHRRRIGDEL